MNVYELVNPSDDYSFEAPDDQVAAYVALAVGQGRYDARLLGDREASNPIMCMLSFYSTAETVDDDVKKLLGGLSLNDFLAARTAEVVAALRSLVIGNRADLAASLIGRGEQEAATLKAAWHEKHRTSMTDIGKYANDMADSIVKKYGK